VPEGVSGRLALQAIPSTTIRTSVAIPPHTAGETPPVLAGLGRKTGAEREGTAGNECLEVSRPVEEALALAASLKNCSCSFRVRVGSSVGPHFTQQARSPSLKAPPLVKSAERICAWHWQQYNIS